MGASKRIKMALLDKDVSQVQLAEKMDKPVQNLYNMLNRDAMSYATVEYIADLINCDVVLIDRETKRIY